VLEDFSEAGTDRHNFVRSYYSLLGKICRSPDDEYLKLLHKVGAAHSHALMQWSGDSSDAYDEYRDLLDELRAYVQEPRRKLTEWMLTQLGCAALTGVQASGYAEFVPTSWTPEVYQDIGTQAALARYCIGVLYRPGLSDTTLPADSEERPAATVELKIEFAMPLAKSLYMTCKEKDFFKGKEKGSATQKCFVHSFDADWTGKELMIDHGPESPWGMFVKSFEERGRKQAAFLKSTRQIPAPLT
jgi:hypothetical protein